MKRIVITAAAFGVLAIAGCTSTTTAAKTSAVAPATPSSTASATPAATPAPVPSPDGTYTGSCDYILAGSTAANSYLVGEVDLTNTGNIGTVNRVRMTWPQEGSPPVAAHHTVRVAAGASKVVRFHVSAGSIDAGSPVIDQLQSWQSGHGDRNGCTDKVTIIRTYGAAH
jgi:hypothetical protein